MESKPQPIKPRAHGPWSVPAECLVVASAVAAAVWLAPTAHWRLTWFAAIAAFTLLGELTAVAVGSMYVSGSFLGILLAAVSFGGSPAAALGAITICAGWLHSREDGHMFRTNLATYIWFPLLTGAAFHAATSLTRDQRAGLLPARLRSVRARSLPQFLGIAGYGCYVQRTSLRAKVREAFAPVLSSGVGLGTSHGCRRVCVYHLGTVELIYFGIVLVVFQYLVGELLTSKRRSDALHRIAAADELTNLANREHFRAEVERRIGLARETRRPLLP